MRRLVVSLLPLLIVACAKGELSSPCEEDKDCERDLECISTGVRPGVLGFQCSAFCADSADCSGGICFGGTYCARECDPTAPDCPDGTVCAGSFAKCVLPCFADTDCEGTGLPFCPVPGGPCSDAK